MSMERVTIRLPSGTVRAYDSADGNRSKVMRSVLSGAVADGQVEGVPEDLRTLAAVEDTVQKGALPRRRGTFRKRCAEFFKEKYRSGYVTPDDAEEMAESWRNEAVIYGAEYLAWVEAITGWYAENWDPSDAVRSDWPDPGAFHARTDPDSVDVPERLVRVLQEAEAEGIAPAEAVRRVSKYHDSAQVQAAAQQAFGQAVTDGGVTE